MFQQRWSSSWVRVRVYHCDPHVCIHNKVEVIWQRNKLWAHVLSVSRSDDLRYCRRLSEGWAGRLRVAGGGGSRRNIWENMVHKSKLRQQEERPGRNASTRCSENPNLPFTLADHLFICSSPFYLLILILYPCHRRHRCHHVPRSIRYLVAAPLLWF